MALTRRAKVSDHRLQELVGLGYDRDSAQAWISAQEPETDAAAAAAAPFVVWPQNWPVLGLFMRVQRQWRRTPAGRLDGLRITQVEAAMRLMGLRNRVRLFEQLHDMELAALEADHEL